MGVETSIFWFYQLPHKRIIYFWLPISTTDGSWKWIILSLVPRSVTVENKKKGIERSPRSGIPLFIWLIRFLNFSQSLRHISRKNVRSRWRIRLFIFGISHLHFRLVHLDVYSKFWIYLVFYHYSVRVYGSHQLRCPVFYSRATIKKSWSYHCNQPSSVLLWYRDL